MDTLTINTLWRPVFGKLVQGLRLLTPEWRILADLENFEQLSPRQINWAVDLIFGGGIAYTVDGGSTARAVSTAPVEATDTWRHMTRRFEVSYDIFNASGQKFAAQQVSKQMRYQVRQAIRSFQKAVSINFYGSKTGTVALVDDGAPGAGINVDSLYGTAGLAVPRRFFTPGAVGAADTVAVLNPADGAIRGAPQRLTAVAAGAAAGELELTLAAAPTGAADNDLVVFSNHKDGTSTDRNRWFNGLRDIISDTSILHGLDPATQPDWVPGINVANLAAALSGNKLARWFTDVELDSGFAPNFAWTTSGVIAAAGGTQLDQRRYTSEEDTMRLGFKNLRVMGVQTRAMPFCPAGEFYSGSTKALRRLSPDSKSSEPTKVETGGPGEFVYYGDNLGYFCDHVFRPQLTVVSRKALIGVRGVTEEAIS